MHIYSLHFTELSLGTELMPVIFRGVFVVFLIVVMFSMRDDDKKGIERIKD